MSYLSRFKVPQLGYDTSQFIPDHWTERNIMLPQDFYNSPPELMWLFFEGQAVPLAVKKLKYFEDKPFCSRAKHNPLYQNESNRITSVKNPLAHAKESSCRIQHDGNVYFINKQPL